MSRNTHRHSLDSHSDKLSPYFSGFHEWRNLLQSGETRPRGFRGPFRGRRLRGFRGPFRGLRGPRLVSFHEPFVRGIDEILSDDSFPAKSQPRVGVKGFLPYYSKPRAYPSSVLRPAPGFAARQPLPGPRVKKKPPPSQDWAICPRETNRYRSARGDAWHNRAPGFAFLVVVFLAAAFPEIFPFFPAPVFLSAPAFSMLR